jgi:hypothetical protein
MFIDEDTGEEDLYKGEIKSVHGTGANALFNVVFDDGDEEDLDMHEVNLHLAHEKTPPSSKKGNTKRKRKEHEGESDDTDGVKVTPPPPPTQINNHGRGPNWRST